MNLAMNLAMADSASLSGYEKQRLANMAANRRVLESLGLGGGGHGGSFVPSSKKLKTPIKKKRARPAASPADNGGSYQSACRTSPRLRQSSEGALLPLGKTDSMLPWPQERTPEKVEKPPDTFGEVPGFPVGSFWEMRAECCADLVHRATVAGIVGTPESGCYSIVLNGGYADDVDDGELLTYTGSGGRSLKGTAANPKNLRTGPATHDQTLDGKEGRYNAALYKSHETRQPVRVVRGYKLDSQWAPLGVDFGGEANYRYDGLYTVERAWLGMGLEGFRVWKFALKRQPGQPELMRERVEED